MKEITDINNKQSVVINAMRFPLIIIVLYMHIIPLEPKPITFGFSGMQLYTFISELLSHNIGRMAVPCFFLFSGYLYFRKMEKWSGSFYLSQQKKRLKTLVLPYILWNILNIAIVFIKGTAFNALGMDGSGDINFIKSTSFYELMVMPIDLPLWYLRDLICMTFLAPLFYYLFRYTKSLGIIVLLLLYFTTWELPFRGFSLTAIFYFGLGAYWGIGKQNILEKSSKHGYLWLTLSFIFVLVATLNNLSPWHEVMIRLFALTGVLSGIFLTGKLINYKQFASIPLKFAPAVFFIYAVHELYFKNWVKGAFFRTPLSESGWGMVVGYVVMPLVLLFICLVLYYLMKRILPKTLSILNGGRN